MYCDICINGKIENEVHFLFRCSYYSDIRNSFKIYKLITQIKVMKNNIMF